MARLPRDRTSTEQSSSESKKSAVVSAPQKERMRQEPHGRSCNFSSYDCRFLALWVALQRQGVNASAARR